MGQEQIQIQMEQLQMQPAAAAGIGIGMIIVWLVIYVFFAFCLAHMAKKMGRPFGKSFILALIPIVNIFWLIGLAGKPYWWFILFLIPIANIVAMILIWMSLAEKRGYPNWWGILIGLVPIVNIVLFLIIVFGKGKQMAAAPAA
jgi:hypothetical protein